MDESIKYMTDVMLASANGNSIQRCIKGNFGCWVDDEDPDWDWACFDYRVKPPMPKIFYVVQVNQIGTHMAYKKMDNATICSNKSGNPIIPMIELDAVKGYLPKEFLDHAYKRR